MTARAARCAHMRAAVFLALGLCLSGCLSDVYRIPTDEAARLAQLDPELRGKHVRVTQQTGLGEELEPRVAVVPVGGIAYQRYGMGTGPAIGVPRTAPHGGFGGGGA